MKFTPNDAMTALQAAGGAPFLELFRQDSLSVEIYAPQGQDLQHPHDRDEMYVIISGQGDFQHGPDRYPFQSGDLIFVKAGVDHRFLDFSEDFKTWVIFF